MAEGIGVPRGGGGIVGVHVEGGLRMVVVARGRRRWGTWEELILGGAVLRHGTQSWGAVASELRARTLFPYSFTPEACKAKYEDLKQRYSGCKAWFEELRKKRVAELRQELEKSDDSIGSLECKLESLKAEKENCCHLGYGSSRTASPVPILTSERVESSGKETSKDGLSAGSFCQIPESVAEMSRRPDSDSSEQEKISSIKKSVDELSESSKQEKLPGNENLAETSNEQGVTLLQKRRGKRKRKDYYNREPRELSVGESENLGSTNVVENSTSECGPMVRSSSMNDYEIGSCGVGNGDLRDIFTSVAENKYALVFRRRLDSQKRARYKKTVRWHMDFDTIRARISSCSITSVKELFRDLLLLANNALVFYSKRTREYKTALLLRDIVTKAYRQHCMESSTRSASPLFPLSPMCNPPVKPRSVRLCNRKLPAKLPNAENVIDGIPQVRENPRNVENMSFGTRERLGNPSNAENSEVCRMQSNSEPRPSPESMFGKKICIRARKVGCGSSRGRPKGPIEDRKRARRR